MADNFEDLTVEDLKKLAADREIEGRSKMNREELVAAIQEADDPEVVPKADYDAVVQELAATREELARERGRAQQAPDPEAPIETESPSIEQPDPDTHRVGAPQE